MLRRRGVALLLALAIELVLVLLLFFLVPDIVGTDKPGRAITTFSVDAPESDEAEAEKARDAPAAAGAQRRQPTSPQPTEEMPSPTTPDAPQGELPFLVLTRDQYRSAQINNLPRGAPDAPANADAGARSGAGASHANDSDVVGKGPKGQPLYAAEWHVRPTNAQLRTYIGDRARSSGWGLIACRTIANYRVEDCQEMGESPRGSGLSGAVRQAAWQFRVRPPRIGGKEMVGEWVSIRIDYTITSE